MQLYALVLMWITMLNISKSTEFDYQMKVEGSTRKLIGRHFFLEANNHANEAKITQSSHTNDGLVG